MLPELVCVESRGREVVTPVRRKNGEGDGSSELVEGGVWRPTRRQLTANIRVQLIISCIVNSGENAVIYGMAKKNYISDRSTLIRIHFCSRSNKLEWFHMCSYFALSE